MNNFENEHHDPVFEPQQFTEYAMGSGDDEIGNQRKLPVNFAAKSECWSSGESVGLQVDSSPD